MDRGARIEAHFVWDAVNGYRPAAEYLTETFGIDLTGFEITEIELADDGETLIGKGTRAGYERAWVLLEPAALPLSWPGAVGLALLVFGLRGIAGRKRN